MQEDLNGLKVSFVEKINFSFVCDNNNHHTFTFKIMSNPDNTVFAIIYQWADDLAKIYNNHEEAFFIENITTDKLPLAKTVINEVYKNLYNAFNNDSFQQYDFSSSVREIIDKYRVNTK